MILRQSRLGIKTSFEFNDERLTYVTSDSSGERVCTVPYEAVQLDDLSALSLPSARPTMYLWAAGFPTGFAALRVGYDHQVLGAILGIIGFALILIGIVAKDWKWFVIRLDIIPVSTGGALPLRVLRDGNHDEIIARLVNGRRHVLRARHATINLAADPDREKARFDWLLEQGIIDASEHAAAIMALSVDDDEMPLQHALN